MPVFVPVTVVDIKDIVDRLRARAHLLQLVGEGMDRLNGGAVAQLADDLKTELDMLVDGLDNLEVAA